MSAASTDPRDKDGLSHRSLQSLNYGRLLLFVAAFLLLSMTQTLINHGRDAETVDLAGTVRARVEVNLANDTVIAMSSADAGNTGDAGNAGNAGNTGNISDDPSAPVLVLDIGPHKTGSSTIQCDLNYFRTPLYQNASVAYLGRSYGHCRNRSDLRSSVKVYDIDTRKVLSQCQKSSSCNEHPSWKKLEKYLNHLSKRNVSAIISDEAFSRMKIRPSEEEEGVAENFKMLYSLFNKYYPGRVHVAMVYRWYHEWHLSRWNEGNKPYGNNPSKSATYEEKYQAWPSEGGKHELPFSTYYENHIQNISRFVEMELALDENKTFEYATLAEMEEEHPIEYLHRLWSEYSDSVDVLDFHDMAVLSKDEDRPGEDMVTYFLGRVLPSQRGRNTMVKLKRKGVGEGIGRSNPSMNIDYDLLAIKAHELGLLSRVSRVTGGRDGGDEGERNATNTTLERQFVAQTAEKELMNYLESVESADPASNLTNLTHNLPMICLSDLQYRDFLQKSLEFEKRVSVLSGYHPEEAEVEQRLHILESALWEAVEKKKFCNMDVDAMMENKNVREFFRRMESSESRA